MVVSQEEHLAGDVPVVGRELEQTAGYESKVPTVNELHEEEIMRLPVELVEVVPNIHEESIILDYKDYEVNDEHLFIKKR